MIQKPVFLLVLGITTIYAGYTGPNTGNYLGNGAASGGFGYGYSSDNHQGYGPGVAAGAGSGVGQLAAPGVDPQIFQQIPFDFSTLIQGTRAFAYTSVSLYPPFQGRVMARSRITYDGLQQLQNQIQQVTALGVGQATGSIPAFSGHNYENGPTTGGFGPGNFANEGVSLRSGGALPSSYGGYGSGFGGSYGTGYGGSFSSSSGTPGGFSSGASARIGPQGGQQSAYLNPENPANPNVNVRFGSGLGGGDGKTYTLYTSSSSGSGNIDGKPYGYRRASTSINDNGKVSSYVVSD